MRFTFMIWFLILLTGMNEKMRSGVEESLFSTSILKHSLFAFMI